MPDSITPTERELQILKVLWDKKQASVREVHQEMSKSAPIVQNTVQAFLRTMEEKGLVKHRTDGRTFIYTPLHRHDKTKQRMVSRLLSRVFDGAIDQLVQSALELRQPTPDELAKLESMIQAARKERSKP